MSRLKSIANLENALPLVALAWIEFFCFFPAMRKVGFYLDDWATMAYLHFAPKNQGIFEFFKYYLLNDSRVQNRPLEVIHFGLIHWLFGGEPFPFHLTNVLMEILAGYLAYLVFLRVSESRAISMLAAIFFILHPAHDSSHYWVICSSVTLSLCLYLGSLVCLLHFADGLQACTSGASGQGKPGLLWAVASSLCFFLSLLNYETLLPLAAVNVLLVFFVLFAGREKTQGQLMYALKVAAGVAALMALPVVLLLGYLKVVMPLLGKGYVHGVVFDLETMLQIVGSGVDLNTPLTLFHFVFQQASNTFGEITKVDWLHLAAISLVSFLSVFLLCQIDLRRNDEASKGQFSIRGTSGLWLVLIGVIGVIASYSIFGLNAEYTPTYYTILNRINAGASFCSAIILLGFLKLANDNAPARANGVAPFALAFLAALFASAFTSANLALAKPWVASWATQTAIKKNIVVHAAELGRAPSLLLVNCPRYVLWSPVFDGVWDFSNMLRIALDDFNVNANVISERLTLDEKGATDISHGFQCGQYPFSKLFLFVAPDGPLERVVDERGFVDTVKRKGMGFGLAPDIVEKWEEELSKK